MKVEVTCCEGNDQRGTCLRHRCPHYQKAWSEVTSRWPYCGTGFGNLYGNPTHEHFLARVRRNLEQQSGHEVNK